MYARWRQRRVQRAGTAARGAGGDAGGFRGVRGRGTARTTPTPRDGSGDGGDGGASEKAEEGEWQKLAPGLVLGAALQALPGAGFKMPRSTGGGRQHAASARATGAIGPPGLRRCEASTRSGLLSSSSMEYGFFFLTACGVAGGGVGDGDGDLQRFSPPRLCKS